jgi:hypothetical protein
MPRSFLHSGPSDSSIPAARARVFSTRDSADPSNPTARLIWLDVCPAYRPTCDGDVNFITRIRHVRTVVRGFSFQRSQHLTTSAQQRHSFDSTSADTSVAQAPEKRSVARALGLGLITGAADDDPSAIGTYAAAGAKVGPTFLWTAAVTFPMMFAVVYLSAKLGQVTGK